MHATCYLESAKLIFLVGVGRKEDWCMRLYVKPHRYVFFQLYFSVPPLCVTAETRSTSTDHFLHANSGGHSSRASQGCLVFSRLQFHNATYCEDAGCSAVLGTSAVMTMLPGPPSAPLPRQLAGWRFAGLAGAAAGSGRWAETGTDWGIQGLVRTAFTWLWQLWEIHPAPCWTHRAFHCEN